MKFMDTHTTRTTTNTKVVRRKKDGKSAVTSDDVIRAAEAGNANYHYFVATGKLPVTK